jgi:hypothetical protein
MVRHYSQMTHHKGESAQIAWDYGAKKMRRNSLEWHRWQARIGEKRLYKLIIGRGDCGRIENV